MDEKQATVRLINAKLDLILAKLDTTTMWEDSMSAEIDRISRSVAQLTSVTQSAIALMQGFAQEIRNRVGDDQALHQLADEIDQRNTELANAVTSNTGSPSTSPTTTQSPTTTSPTATPGDTSTTQPPSGMTQRR